jgi:hypothetical protein
VGLVRAAGGFGSSTSVGRNAPAGVNQGISGRRNTIFLAGTNGAVSHQKTGRFIAREALTVPEQLSRPRGKTHSLAKMGPARSRYHQQQRYAPVSGYPNSFLSGAQVGTEVIVDAKRKRGSDVRAIWCRIAFTVAPRRKVNTTGLTYDKTTITCCGSVTITTTGCWEAPT